MIKSMLIQDTYNPQKFWQIERDTETRKYSVSQFVRGFMSVSRIALPVGQLLEILPQLEGNKHVSMLKEGGITYDTDWNILTDKEYWEIFYVEQKD